MLTGPHIFLFLCACEKTEYFSASKGRTYFIKRASPKDFGQLAIPQCLSGDENTPEVHKCESELARVVSPSQQMWRARVSYLKR